MVMLSSFLLSTLVNTALSLFTSNSISLLLYSLTEWGQGFSLGNIKVWGTVDPVVEILVSSGLCCGGIRGQEVQGGEPPTLTVLSYLGTLLWHSFMQN